MKWKSRQRELARLRKKHRAPWRAPLPDLSTPPTAPSLSNGFARIVDKKAERGPTPPGIIVDTLHKQGMQVLSRAELPWAGGKKS